MPYCGEKISYSRADHPAQSEKREHSCAAEAGGHHLRYVEIARRLLGKLSGVVYWVYSAAGSSGSNNQLAKRDWSDRVIPLAGKKKRSLRRCARA